MRETGVRSVLIIDDDGPFTDVLAELLRYCGINEVMCAHDGRDAAESYRRSLPERVIMDMEMPVLNGYYAAKAIREVDPSANIFILTGNPDHQDALRAVREGLVCGLHRKPITLPHLLEAMQLEAVTGRGSADHHGEITIVNPGPGTLHLSQDQPLTQATILP